MTDELDKIHTSRGEARSITPLSTDAMGTDVAPGEGADWFGPRQPMRPLANPEVASRQFDFVTGFNLATQPRAYEEVGFHELRALADAYDPVRIIIERRKDQMTRLSWQIRVKHEDGGKRPKAAQLSPQMRGVIRDVTQFFRQPAYGLSFRSWLRAILEDALVIDAPTLFCERDGAGNLVELLPIDGATVKRIIDDEGRAPRPFRWDGTPFNWLGQTVEPSNMYDTGFRIVDGLVYPPSFQRVLKGLPAANASSWDIIQKLLNPRSNHAYGFSPVQQIITTISIAMRRSMSQLEYFREGNQPESIYGLPETWTPDKVQQFQEYFDNLFVGNLGNRRRMKFLPGGANNAYTALKEPPLKNEFDEWLVRIVCAAFSYPPQAFTALSNRSTAEQHEKTAEEEGLGPLKLWFADLANEILDREFSEEVEFAWAEEEEVDPVKQATILGQLVDKGIYSRNRAREILGEEPDPSPAANRLMVTTATGVVPIDGDNKPTTTGDNNDA